MEAIPEIMKNSGFTIAAEAEILHKFLVKALSQLSGSFHRENDEIIKNNQVAQLFLVI